MFEGIRTKLSSAQRDDKPRWGNCPEKLELSYIENLIRTGGWFDGEHPFLDVADQPLDGEVYAPEFFRSQRERFGYLLNRPQIGSLFLLSTIHKLGCD